MERRPTSILTTLAVSVLALTLIAPWTLAQDPDAIMETRRRAEQGDADAQYNLGYRYVTGIGVPQDRAEAVRWLRLAADQGHTQAEDFLGRMPPMGSQRATDNVAETELPATLPPATGQSPRSGNPFRVPSLRTDAEQGNADAQFNLGVMYANGEDVPRDAAEAVRWYRLAADQGHAAAQYNLGGMYALGEGVLKNDAEAIGWYRLAAEQDHATAQYNLGVHYANGKGVLKDDVEAAHWFRLAAAQGDAAAQYFLGGMYAFGEGVLKDEDEAVRWFRLATEQGHAGAQFSLGVSYAVGRAVLKDSVLTHMWYNIAGANGDETARESRDNLERDMTRAEISRATELARTCMASNYQDCEP